MIGWLLTDMGEIMPTYPRKNRQQLSESADEAVSLIQGAQNYLLNSKQTEHYDSVNVVIAMLDNAILALSEAPTATTNAQKGI